MSSIDPRVQASLEAAMNLVRATGATASRAAVVHIEGLVHNAVKPAEREQYFLVLQELRRGAGVFESTFYQALRERVAQELTPRNDAKRKLESADWATLSLVEDAEVEERMNFVRLGQFISHECESQLRDLAAYMGSLLSLGRADEDRNPLRADVIGAALNRAIEAVSGDRESRRILGRELGQVVAHAMPGCYDEILEMLRQRGVQPVNLSVRTVEGPGNRLHGVSSAYASLPGRDGRLSTRGTGYDEYDEPSGRGGLDLLAAHRRALESAFPGSQSRDSGSSANLGRGRTSGRSRLDTAAADEQLMTLLRRLTAVPSRSGEFDHPTTLLGGGRNGDVGRAGDNSTASGSSAYPSVPSMTGRGSGRDADLGTSGRGGESLESGASYGNNMTGMMAVNLIRAHRDELMSASTGKLDHMVIDVVGSLFDQILSDSRVPPQMAREIARLQLPVLRVALNDSTFFSTRRHPVRRFINRIASLANAFDDFSEGQGAEFLQRVRKLVDDIVEGDFDQIELYAAKVAELEQFIAGQTEDEAERTGAVTTLEAKESELRTQQRYMLQLRSLLGPVGMPGYLNDFIAEVWSQALVLAVRRDGDDSDRAKRYRRVGADLVMSVQPKGSPMLRKKFLMQLPPLMKDLNEGMRLIGWPEAAQKAFFAKLLPAHAESLKATPLSELDYNLKAKQLEAIFSAPVPVAETMSRGETPAVESTAIEKRFTPEEAERIGFVPEAAVDWANAVTPAPVDVDIDLDVAGDPSAMPVTASSDPPAHPAADAATPAAETVDAAVAASAAALGPITSESGDPGEPTKGPQLIDHIKLGFAYQMHLKDEWQKVRLAHVSSGRTFFVFTRGGKHQETISMTSRMLARMCETGRMRAVESAYLMERATQRARKQLAELAVPTRH